MTIRLFLCNSRMYANPPVGGETNFTNKFFSYRSRRSRRCVTNFMMTKVADRRDVSQVFIKMLIALTNRRVSGTLEKVSNINQNLRYG